MMGMMGMRNQKLGIKNRLDEHERIDFGENLEETRLPNLYRGFLGQTSRRVGNGPSKNSIFMLLARSQSCVSQCFLCFMLSMKVNSIVILNFHWDLLYIVDMSECEKRFSFWEVSVPKASAAAIFFR